MAPAPMLRVRRSFREVEKDHLDGKKVDGTPWSELETLIRAFKGIMEKPHTDQNSFFVIAGLHGSPFRGAGWSNSMWWGGYCYHGQILFPTWHRGYVLRIEDALRSVDRCENVALPFMDWCDDETRSKGLPVTFTQPKFKLSDDHIIDNPLFSYKFQLGVFSNVATYSPGNTDYTKPAGYCTVRFPYSGLVGSRISPEQKKITEEYNATIPAELGVKYLNENIIGWLNRAIKLSDGETEIGIGTYDKFKKCLNAPNYTLFSNTSSAQQHNQEVTNRENVSFRDKDGVEKAGDEKKLPEIIVPLESPHNDMHLAVGGFSLQERHSKPPKDPSRSVPVPKDLEQSKEGKKKPEEQQKSEQEQFNFLWGPNGDMGENDTAAFDPIFFFHHCFIDRMFWLWQQRHGQTKYLVIEPQHEFYPGTNNFDSQGPTPGRVAGEWLSLDTPLEPFKNWRGKPLSSWDVVDIEYSLGYTYGEGSFSKRETGLPSGTSSPEIRKSLPPPKIVLPVSGVDRTETHGSFVIAAWGWVEGEKERERTLLGYESVLSRRQIRGCANCQTHLGVKAYIPVYGLDQDVHSITKAQINVVKCSHDDPEMAKEGMKYKGKDTLFPKPQ